MCLFWKCRMCRLHRWPNCAVKLYRWLVIWMFKIAVHMHWFFLYSKHCLSIKLIFNQNIVGCKYGDTGKHVQILILGRLTNIPVSGTSFLFWCGKNRVRWLIHYSHYFKNYLLSWNPANYNLFIKAGFPILLFIQKLCRYIVNDSMVFRLP